MLAYSRLQRDHRAINFKHVFRIFSIVYSIRACTEELFEDEWRLYRFKARLIDPRLGPDHSALPGGAMFSAIFGRSRTVRFQRREAKSCRSFRYSTSSRIRPEADIRS
jgi:hypothetical protein